MPFQLSGIQHIEGVSSATLAVSIPFGIVATGLILGWLWFRTQSIWLVAIAHGASNTGDNMRSSTRRIRGTPDRDIRALNIGFLALLLVGVILLSRSSDFRRGMRRHGIRQNCSLIDSVHR